MFGDEFLFGNIDEADPEYVGENLYISSTSAERWGVDEGYALEVTVSEAKFQSLRSTAFGIEDLPNEVPAEYEFTGFMEDVFF